MTEDNDVKSETDCMDQEKEQPKMLPAPEKKTRLTLELSIDIKDLYTNVPEAVAPENQSVWQCREDMSKEYMELNRTLQILAMYIVRCCNEGAEVKDNINKRLLLLRTIFGIILDHAAITGYDAYGILLEMLQDTFMKVSGRKHVERIFKEIEKEQEEIAQEKASDYTS